MNEATVKTPFNLSIPTKVCYVPNAASSVLEDIKVKGIRNVSVLIDGGAMKNNPIKTFLEQVEDDIGIESLVIYDGGEPTYAKLEEIRNQFDNKSPGGIFAIGGGSAIDVGKAMAVLLTNPGPALDYRGFDKATRPTLPIITVPTVSGTGSEITPNASFVDDQEMRKLGINGECVRPTYAIIDPSLTLSCPKQAVLSSAVDSIVHATEAFVAKKSNPISRFFAKEAFVLTCSNLEDALADTPSLAPRCSLALASLYAALAMMNSGTGPAAAMSYPMGVRYSVPHGFAGAVFLPFVAEITKEAGCMLHQELIAGIAPTESTYSDFVSSLWARVGMPQDIERMGLITEEEEVFVNDTLELSAALEQHPTPFGKEQIKTVIKRIREANRNGK